MRGILQRTLHPSWLVAWFAAALIGGIGLSYWAGTAAFGNAGWLAVAAILLGIACVKRTGAMVGLAVAGGLLLGLWRGASIRLATAEYAPYYGHGVQLSGTIADDVSHKNGEAGLKLQAVNIGGRLLAGDVWAGTAASNTLMRGDNVTLSGKLAPGFGPFAASMSFARLVRVARPAHTDAPDTIRNAFTAGLRHALPEPAALLGIGYLTGQHNDLPAALTEQLQLVGLIHLVIAGGYNVTILVRFARRAFGKLSKYLALIASGGILAGLTIMAGFSAPMARTAVVTGLSLGAWYYGRRLHPLVLLPVSAAITALAAPAFVWGDVGWYLTFAAYGGLILLAPVLRQLLWQGKPVGIAGQIFVDTLSVQAATMPLLAFAFQQYSIYGLPANLFVLPLMPLTMLATGIAGVAGMVLPAAAAHLAGWPAAVLLGYTEHVTVWFAGLPGADFSAAFSAAGMAVAYVILLALIYILWRKIHYDFRAENIVD